MGSFFYCRQAGEQSERWKLQGSADRHGSYNSTKKDPLGSFFLLPTGKASKASGGRLQGSVAKKVLFSKVLLKAVAFRFY